jgi:WD40 repeat protein
MSDGDKNEYKYWAFISYSHQDRAWGDWLHKTLETYRVPRRLIGRPSRDGDVPARLFPVFRDRDELPSSANLGDVLNESLRQSRYQIVICSPRSAASKWVNEEIKYFKSLGREDRVLCLIVDGEPNVVDVPGRDIEECFAPALRYRVDARGQLTDIPAEPIAADAREHADGKRGAKLKLVSGLLGVGLDEIVQRERQREFWKRVQIGAAALAFAAFCASGWQWFQNERAAREREIVIEKLVESGRQELLDGHQARAAVFLNEAYKRGEDNAPLRFMLAQAMQPVDALTDIRVRHGGVAAYRSAFSPDGRSFAIHALLRGSGEQYAVIKLFNAATGQQIAELPDAPALPLQLSFLADGRRLMATGYPDDNRIGAPQTHLWNLDAPSAPLKIPGIHGMAGRNLHADGRQLLSASEGGLSIHDAASGAVLRRLLDHESVTAASYSDDGEHLAVGLADGRVTLHTADGAPVRTLAGDAAYAVAGLMFTPDGRKLIALSAYGDVRIWETDSGRLTLAFAADPLYVTELQLDGSGVFLLTIGSEGYKVWSTGRGVLLFAQKRALAAYASAAISPDGSMLITTDYHNRIAEAWDVRARQLSYTFDLHSDGVSSAAFDTAGQRLLLTSRDGTASLWNMPVRPQWQLESHEFAPRTLRFDADGRTLLVGGGDYGQGRAELFDVETRASLRRYDGHQSAVVYVAFSPDAENLITASLDGTARLWNRSSGALLAILNHGPLGLETAQFSADGRYLLTTSDTTQLGAQDAAGVWDAATGRHIAWLRHEGMIMRAAFDGESGRIATGGTDHAIRIWNATDGSLLRTLTGHTEMLRSVQFSRDGHHLLSAAHDGSVRIWDAETGMVIHQLADAALGLVTQALYAPDERRVAIASQSGNVWLWQPDSGETSTLKGHLQEVLGLRYSIDGELLYSLGRDGSVRSWDVVTGRPTGLVSLHPRELHDFDFDASETLMAASAWGQFSLSRIGRERRSPRELASRLACAVPWALDAATLALTAKAAADSCESVAASD